MGRWDPLCSPCSTPEATEVLLLLEMLEMQSFFLRTELLLVNATEFLNLHGILRSKTNCVCSLHIGSSLRAPSHCRLRVFMQAL